MLKSSSSPSIRRDAVAYQRQARRDLLLALREQFQRDSVPWLIDLVAPILQGPPQPLIGTRRARELADPDSKFISISGLDIHYKEHLSHDFSAPATETLDEQTSFKAQPNVICLHGFQGSTFSYRKILTKLASPRVLAYDRPPFGLSSRPRSSPGNNPYSLSSSAKLCCDLVKALQLDEGQGVVLIGHSAGCPVAIQTASLLPNVKGLILIAPAVDASDPKKNEGFLSRLDAGQLLRFALIRAIISDQNLGINYIRRSLLKRKEEAIEGYLKPLQADDWDVGSLELARSFDLSSSTLDFSIQCPVLVIQGSDDKTIRPNAALAVAEKFKERKGCLTIYKELEKCAHVPMEEKDQEVIQSINEFLLK